MAGLLSVWGAGRLITHGACAMGYEPNAPIFAFPAPCAPLPSVPRVDLLAELRGAWN